MLEGKDTINTLAKLFLSLTCYKEHNKWSDVIKSNGWGMARLLWKNI